MTTWSPSDEERHALPAALDDARALVAEHGRRVAGGVHPGGGVHVGVADAARDQPHEHLARARAPRGRPPARRAAWRTPRGPRRGSSFASPPAAGSRPDRTRRPGSRASKRARARAAGRRSAERSHLGAPCSTAGALRDRARRRRRPSSARAPGASLSPSSVAGLASPIAGLRGSSACRWCAGVSRRTGRVHGLAEPVRLGFGAQHLVVANRGVVVAALVTSARRVRIRSSRGFRRSLRRPAASSASPQDSARRSRASLQRRRTPLRRTPRPRWRRP